MGVLETPAVAVKAGFFVMRPRGAMRVLMHMIMSVGCAIRVIVSVMSMMAVPITVAVIMHVRPELHCGGVGCRSGRLSGWHAL